MGIAVALRRRFGAWSGIFDDALRSQGAAGNAAADGLGKEAFTKALLSIHARLSKAQAEALFSGYVVGTDKADVNMVGFCGIAEAVSINDAYAAEFADISLEKFVSLGEVKVFKELGLEGAATRIQRMVRRNQASAKT